MQFSIIIPTKNELENLKNNLPQFDAVRKQFSAELIVADGASTDGTIELARKKADRVVVKTKKDRETIGEGRNRGAAAAQGDILVFLDAGVIVPHPLAFFKTIADAFKDKRIIAATTQVNIDPKEATWQDRAVHTFVNGTVWLWNLLGIGAGKGEVQIMRRAAFRRAGGYNEALSAAEDNDLYRRLARFGTVVFLHELEVYDDPRRYRKLGYPRVIGTWILNQLSVLVFGKSFSKEWKRID